MNDRIKFAKEFIEMYDKAQNNNNKDLIAYIDDDIENIVCELRDIVQDSESFKSSSSRVTYEMKIRELTKEISYKMYKFLNAAKQTYSDGVDSSSMSMYT